MYFRQNDEGNVAMMIALSLLPIMMLIVLAVEFSRQQVNEREASASLDATVLAVAIEQARNGGTAADLQTYAQAYFDSNIPAQAGVTYEPLALSMTGDQEITLELVGRMPSAMLGIFGAEKLEYFLETSAVAGDPPELEIMLVVDVSNSMSGPRITALRNAVDAMVDEVIDPENELIRVGMVPFNNYVNVGVSNRNASWLDAPDDRVTEVESCPIDFTASEGAGCSFRTVCTQDGQFGNGSEGCVTETSCSSGGDPIMQPCTTIEIERSWLGCVGSREAPLNITDNDFASNPVPGINSRSNQECQDGNEILPLTHEASDIKSAAAQLEPNGFTYIAPGIVWGLRALSQDAPFDTAKIGNPKDGQIMIVLSDGANTRSKNIDGVRHEGSDLAAANLDTLAACDEAKDAKVEVFTIDFGISDPVTEALLRDCATSPEHAFEADTANQLVSVFRAISGQFSEVRLSN